MKHQIADTLYIIGNGFDLYHGLKTSYWNFKKFVQNRDPDLFELLGRYFDQTRLWSDFESALSELDTDELFNHVNNYLVDYGADDWSDANHHDYEYEIDNVITAITETLKSLFTQWILAIKKKAHPILPVSKTARFLNFNYTTTLETAYGVAGEQILYIHNKAVNMNSILLLGHNRKMKSFNDPRAAEDADPRVWNGNILIDKYYQTTYKHTAQIMQEHAGWFNSLNTVGNIQVLGHSLSAVDSAYFQRIAASNLKAKWTATYHNEEERESHLARLLSYGIDRLNISIIRLEDING